MRALSRQVIAANAALLKRNCPSSVSWPTEWKSRSESESWLRGHCGLWSVANLSRSSESPVRAHLTQRQNALWWSACDQISARRHQWAQSHIQWSSIWLMNPDDFAQFLRFYLNQFVPSLVIGHCRLLLLHWLDRQHFSLGRNLLMANASTDQDNFKLKPSIISALHNLDWFQAPFGKLASSGAWCQ